MKMLKISLKKSLIGRLPSHIETAYALGLRKMHRVSVKPDNPAIRGMIKKIEYLVVVEEIDNVA